MAIKELDVICIGAAIVDIPLQPVSKNIFDIESYPLNKIAMTIGGDAINEATIISRLGYKVALMSRVGKDVVGDFVINACKKDNIDFSSVNVDPDIDTSINIGLVTEDGERTFVTNRNGSLWRTTVEDVTFERFKDARLLSMASIFNHILIDNSAMVKIFRAAKENNLIICADIKKSRDGKGLNDIKEALSYLDYFFPNFAEAAELTGKQDLDEIADVLLECGIKNVVIKAGKKGCFIKTKNERYLISAYKVNGIDTTGAGDNFVAGFITAILDGLSLQDCGKFANATASVSVECVGATTGVQSRQQVDRRMQEYLNS
jgi:sugar/nucleoside kinase (ribokinase family)